MGGLLPAGYSTVSIFEHLFLVNEPCGAHPEHEQGRTPFTVPIIS
jgi:hypothetical protein